MAEGMFKNLCREKVFFEYRVCSGENRSFFSIQRLAEEHPTKVQNSYEWHRTAMNGTEHLRMALNTYEWRREAMHGANLREL